MFVNRPAGNRRYVITGRSLHYCQVKVVSESSLEQLGAAVPRRETGQARAEASFVLGEPGQERAGERNELGSGIHTGGADGQGLQGAGREDRASGGLEIQC